MIVSDRLLRIWAESDGLAPYTPANVNPASIDLCWSGRYRLAHCGGWGAEEQADELVIRPGELLLLDTVEFISVPREWAGFLMLKSSIGRQGLEHLHAGYFDPGFTGTATLEIKNLAPWTVTIKRGQRIVQLVMEMLNEAPQADYTQTGRYSGQTGPTPAR